jgi:hypothetical protein
MAVEWLELKIEPMHPGSLDVRDLAEILEAAHALIYPERTSRKETVSLDIKIGSTLLQLNTSDQKAILNCQDTLNSVNTSRNLDIVHPRFATALRRLQSKSAELHQRFRFVTSQGHPDKGFYLDEHTLLSQSEETWFKTRLYLYGVITSAGGINDPNIHLKTKQFGNIIIRTPHAILAALEQNPVYREVGMYVKAVQCLETGEIRDRHATFIEFLDYDPGISDENIARYLDEDPIVWKDVEDPVAWVRALRDSA